MSQSLKSTTYSMPAMASASDARNRSVAVSNATKLEGDIVKAEDLTGNLELSWDKLRTASNQYVSPFFSLPFTRAVARVRPQSRIAVYSQRGRVVGFLPFEYSQSNLIEPIGKAFNDAHGLICAADDPLRYLDCLSAIGVKCYRFRSLAGHGQGVEPFIMGESPSFLANLAAHPEGYGQYLASHRGTIEKQRRKTKKMIKDLGPMRLDLDCRDEAMLERLIELKRNQYQRTYIYDILGVPWAKEMLRTLWEDTSQSCRGLLSVLYAGDTMVAAHYGMLEGKLLHYWFPTYDTAYHVYSPGTAMFLEIARQATERGIEKIDLGYGDQPYKHKFVDTITHVPYGCVSTCRFSLARERAKVSVIKALKKVPGKPMLKRMVRNWWPSFGGSQFN